MCQSYEEFIMKPDDMGPDDDADPPRIAELSVDCLLAKAAQYRRMAASASTAVISEALRRLAERYEEYAAKRLQQP